MAQRRRRDTRKTAERGYGGAHQAERAKYKPEVDHGTYCRRCGLPIPPGGDGRCPAIKRDGTRCGKNHRGWDLGHSDYDRSVWTGPEHCCCNRAAPRYRKRKQRHSREW